MRFIDKTNCKSAFEKGNDINIKKLGALTEEACKIAELNNLGVMKTRQGYFRIIKKSGLGAYEDVFNSLSAVDAFFKTLAQHASTRY